MAASLLRSLLNADLPRPSQPSSCFGADNQMSSVVLLIVVYSAFFFASDLVNQQTDYAVAVLFQIGLLLFLVQCSLFVQFRAFAYLQIAAIVLNAYAAIMYLLYVNDISGWYLYNQMTEVYGFFHYLLITLDVAALAGAAYGLHRYNRAT